ncbi:GNAT family N-acetyltransferase [Kineococcus sp. SYSU DK006]|uniref:GNAT family N-acetyltransferase n=1 Tax=Kineococcus sp. SYSU DK006 TaxID=3383127 RepID=UPI003D7D528E
MPLRPAVLTSAVLDTADLQDQACALYRQVLGHGEPGMELNPRLLSALVRNGGSAVGLLEAGRLVAFAYGVHARDEHGEYHYSQSAAVAPGHQGRGLGRQLKQAQAEAVRAHGVRTMRWAYDPVLGRNAHFNLDVLGARARWYVDDFYFRPGTDRVVVEWDLEANPPPAQVAERLVVPAGEVDAAARARVRARFHELLAAGLVAVTCGRGEGGGSVYGFAAPARRAGGSDRQAPPRPQEQP